MVPYRADGSARLFAVEEAADGFARPDPQFRTVGERDRVVVQVGEALSALFGHLERGAGPPIGQDSPDLTWNGSRRSEVHRCVGEVARHGRVGSCHSEIGS